MDIYGFAAGPYQANTYILALNGQALVVDPGLHARVRVESLVAEHGLSLGAIVLTHGHLDHTREAGDLAAAHGVPVYIHSADAPWLDKAPGMPANSRQLFDAEGMLPIADLRDLDGPHLEVCGMSFDLLHAPGHSPGCVIVRGEGFALTGDVVFKGSIGRTDLPGSDPQAMERTLREVVLPLADELALLPGHGPTTSMRAERRSNQFLLAVQQG
ncbi:MBL fold metallo-hydrolase [Corynebacterium lizhenjunii]|uniref:MBL fold metallo-hydrolase n=1 Tax=Corynebacterium lizhenjunii TaxID=2709394 RepID=UPI0013ED3FDB|nr:MBL fold metallo-hydrolase [Corynebacterium lizhenjunii]